MRALKVLLRTESPEDLAVEFWLPISLLHELQKDEVNATNNSTQEDTSIEDLAILEYGATIEAQLLKEGKINEATEDI